jgi:hypothetical protein
MFPAATTRGPRRAVRARWGGMERPDCDSNDMTREDAIETPEADVSLSFLHGLAHL